MSKPAAPFTSHATLIGRVTIAWNTAHYFLFQVFLALQPKPHLEFAEAIFFELKSDRAQRDLTLAATKAMITDPDLRKETVDAIDRLHNLASRRNAVTHAMWAFQPHPDSGKVLWRPHATLSKTDIKAELNALASDILGATVTIFELSQKVASHIRNQRLAAALLTPAPPNKM